MRAAPRQLGRYDLGAVLGSGADGVVHRATLRGPGGMTRAVALKVLADGVGALKREARLGGLLRHRNLVDMYEVSEEDGRWFCAMELCDGGHLGRWTPLPPRAVVEVGLQVCAALQYAHAELGLVHLDIKPRNLLLADGVVKVADLGIARAVGFGWDGRIRGTPRYMPPEQALGGEVDPRADIYALGVTLVELATGETSTFKETVDLDSLDDPVASGPLEGGIPAWLLPAVEPCLEADPADRWPDMAALAEALAALDVEGMTLRDAVGATPTPAPERRNSHTNLDGPREPLFGRERELGRLEAHLETPGVLTLRGPAGVGKSRLAVAAARAYRERTDAQAWFCDLVEVRDEAGLLAAIARVLRVPLGRGESEAQIGKLGRSLRARGPLVLVLDNFEQITHLGGVVATWAGLAPEVRFLATSRQPLGVPGERRVDLGPLDETAATALLVDRARRRGIDLAADPGLPELVARLDGVPLVLELAAGRLGVLSVRDLLEGWDLSLLRSGEEGRHGALRSALDGSWELLDSNQQVTFAQLSVFEGGFTPEEAEAVLALPEGAPPPLDLLDALFERSLLHRMGPGRFRLLVGVHEYAADKLSDRLEVELRHGRAFAAWGRWRAMDGLHGRGGTEARRRLAAGLENLLAAHRRALARGDGRVAAWTALAAQRVFELTAPIPDSLALLEGPLSLELDPEDEARLRLSAAEPSRRLGQMEASRAHLDRALDLGRALGNRRITGHAEVGHGNAHEQGGALDVAIACYRAGLEHARAVRDRSLEAAAWTRIGSAERQLGELGPAREKLQRALRIRRELGDVRYQASVRRTLAIIAMDEGRNPDAQLLLESALAAVRSVGDRRWEGVIMGDLARLNLAMDQPDPAIAWCGGALAIALESGERGESSAMHNNLGMLCLLRGKRVEARGHFEASEGLAREAGNVRSVGIAIGNQGNLDRLEGRPEARERLNEALRIHREMRYTWGQVYWLYGLGLLSASEGDHPAARSWVEEAVATAEPFAAIRGEVLSVLARVHLAAGRLAEARDAIDAALACEAPSAQGARVHAVHAQVIEAEGGDPAEAVAAARGDGTWSASGTEVAQVLGG